MKPTHAPAKIAGATKDKAASRAALTGASTRGRNQKHTVPPERRSPAKADKANPPPGAKEPPLPSPQEIARHDVFNFLAAAAFELKQTVAASNEVLSEACAAVGREIDDLRFHPRKKSPAPMPKKAAPADASRDWWRRLGDDLGMMFGHFIKRARSAPPLTCAALMEAMEACMTKLAAGAPEASRVECSKVAQWMAQQTFICESMDAGGAAAESVAQLEARAGEVAGELSVRIDHLKNEGLARVLAEWNETGAVCFGDRKRDALPVVATAGKAPPGDSRRDAEEWEILKILCRPEELKIISAHHPRCRAPQQWQQLKRGCTAAEWLAVLKGGDEPERLKPLHLMIRMLEDGWKWLLLAPVRVRRRLAEKHAAQLSKPVRLLLETSRPALEAFPESSKPRAL